MECMTIWCDSIACNTNNRTIRCMVLIEFRISTPTELHFCSCLKISPSKKNNKKTFSTTLLPRSTSHFVSFWVQNTFSTTLIVTADPLTVKSAVIKIVYCSISLSKTTATTTTNNNNNSSSLTLPN